MKYEYRKDYLWTPCIIRINLSVDTGHLFKWTYQIWRTAYEFVS